MTPPQVAMLALVLFRLFFGAAFALVSVLSNRGALLCLLGIEMLFSATFDLSVAVAVFGRHL